MKTPKKILILGSGALKIGQAGEFDYSGSQAIKALKEEGIATVLVNPNIATIQTSRMLADSVYFLPVTPFFVEKIITKEKPDAILLSFGGQTALNCGIELHKKGILKKHNVAIIGTPISAIILSEDREKFSKHLKKIGIKTPPSRLSTTVKEALNIAKDMKFPVMVRAGFALGGLGSGIAKNEKELRDICEHAFSFAPQVLVEKYLHHYKEVEYEVVRDSFDNCVTVCNMENMDPLGIHTGESVVVAPSQTLTNFEYHELRRISIELVRSLGIVGECNVQFALNPNPKNTFSRGDATGGIPTARKALERNETRLSTGGRKEAAGPRTDNPPLEYYVIELNARLSRSSALASKATGYPLAYVAAKLALGKSLTEIKNKVTQVTQSCFEPALDYIVVKIPRWDIEKFKGADERIGTSMKSVGEVMGIGRTFEEAYQKAIRMLDLSFEGATSETILKSGRSILENLKRPTPKRMFSLSATMKRGMSVKRIYKLTGIDPWFLYRIKHIVDEEKSTPKDITKLSFDKLLKLKQIGVSDKQLSLLTNSSEQDIRTLRKKLQILPSVFQIDTLAGEFPAKTNYLYCTYNGNHHDVEPLDKEGIIVLGSGPYRIGSSVEFDWTTVNTIQSLKQYKKKGIMINCNPETVSTDYDISDRLYFEELTFERIADIAEFEKPYGTIISVGGQTPNNRAKSLSAYGLRILGTNPVDIDRAEDRNKFSDLLDKLNVNQPAWDRFATLSDALKFCKRVGYPVIIRPSYVLSGTSMHICHNSEELRKFIKLATRISREYPITVSKFIENAKELEFDAVAQHGEIKAFVISEHVENAGVHSGDATITLPAQKVYVVTQNQMCEIAEKIAKALSITGPFNIQFLAKDAGVSVIEVNLRASRTFPFISKVTNIDFMKLFVAALFEKNIPPLKINPLKSITVKVPQFSFQRISGADPVLHVEMASTGEVACFGDSVEEAFLKGEIAVGSDIPKRGIFVSVGGDENKVAFLETAKLLPQLELPIYATEKTTKFLRKHGIKAKQLHKIYEAKSPTALEYFQKGKVDLAINISDSHDKKEATDGFTIRRCAVDYNIPLFTNMQKAGLFIKALVTVDMDTIPIKSWDEYNTTTI